MHKRYKQLFTKKIKIKKADVFATYQALSKDEPHHALLESAKNGRYTMFGLKPFAILKGKGKEFTVESKGKTTSKSGDVLALLQGWLLDNTKVPVPGLPDFQGGAIGYFSYDMARQIERLPELASDDLRLYDFYFLVFTDVFVFDETNEELWIIINGDDGQEAEQRLHIYEKQFSHIYKGEIRSYPTKEAAPYASMSATEFMQAVERVKEYIRAGDVFQVNLSVRQSAPLKTHPFHIYEKLRDINPSPYMAYFHTPEFQFVSGSPELLIKKNGHRLSTRPIAGTRSRGHNAEEDAELESELLANSKERAEHVMLVDLERNDLGRVCKYGSVEVNELMTVEKYSHVMHLVSNVIGELEENRGLSDVIRACFPGGTITGAPKVRTLEIIEELEPVRRGVYTGSIGWIGFNGDFELNIAIRTMIAKDGYAHVQAGAGIVIDSDPKAEYKESLKKAQALWYAKKLSEDEMRRRTI